MFGRDQAIARVTDPETSHDAAASVTDLTGKQKAVLDVLGIYGPMTDKEIYLALINENYWMSTSGARTRRQELVDIGQVEWTGLKKKLKSGRYSRIWFRADQATELEEFAERSVLTFDCPQCGHIFQKEYSRFDFKPTPKPKEKPILREPLFWLSFILFLVSMFLAGRILKII